MKYFALLLLLLALGGAGYWYSQRNIPVVPTTESVGETEPTSAIPAASVVVQDLEIPWDIAFLPEGDMLVTERTGHVIAISAAGAKTEIPIEGITKKGEGGLLGIVLHPDFKTNHFLYLYMSSPGTSGETQNRVVRYRYEAGELHDEKVIIGGIPGAIYHDGGRMQFGPDGMLYITTGDATRSQIAQDKKSLGGKILRLKDDGSIPADNPFGTPVWSYGHRNPQGLAWDSDGRLWETEHGPTGEQGLCCRDEVNLIEKGGNYGWPAIVGDEEKSGMQTPARSSGEDTWAPASLVYLGGSLFFGGLRGEALYEAVLDGERIVEFKEHFKGVYGRIRTVRVGPDDMLYITTSNRDDRGTSKPGDDKIIRIDPTAL
ncbi:MAG TPA: PQQ-dependent sugar dehydrogenase [Candidatus Paceibacterota bacterium]